MTRLPHQIFDARYVSGVLGVTPLVVSEGRIDEVHLQRVLREHYLFEAWWDSAIQFIGDNLDKIKGKIEDVGDAIAIYGENAKGVIAALWAASTDPNALEKMKASTASTIEKQILKFNEPFVELIEYITKLTDEKKIGDKIGEIGKTVLELIQAIPKNVRNFVDTMTSPSGWKGLLTGLAAHLGIQWLKDLVERKILPIVKKAKAYITNPKGAFASDLQKNVDASTKELIDDQTNEIREFFTEIKNEIIDVIIEKFKSLLGEFAVDAIALMAGPLGWIKKLIDLFKDAYKGSDWVLKKLSMIIEEMNLPIEKQDDQKKIQPVSESSKRTNLKFLLESRAVGSSKKSVKNFSDGMSFLIEDSYKINKVSDGKKSRNKGDLKWLLD